MSQKQFFWWKKGARKTGIFQKALFSKFHNLKDIRNQVKKSAIDP